MVVLTNGVAASIFLYRAFDFTCG